MKLLLKKLFLLLNLIALALPLSAADFTHFVGGTDFEPNNTSYTLFFLKDKTSGSNNNDLKFFNNSIFQQDIVVCDNSTGKVEPSNWNFGKNDSFNRVSGTNKTSTNITIKDKDYVVTKPTNISRVNEGSGFNVIKSGLSYVDKFMFISNPENSKAHAHLQYILYNVTKDIDYRLEIAYTNISNITTGDKAIKLKVFIHGYDDSDNSHYIEEVEWSRNAGEDLIRLDNNTGLKNFKPKKNFKKIVITIVTDANSNSTGPKAILGIDYIKVWASENPLPDKTTTPEAKEPYNECVAAEGEYIDLSTRVVIPEGSTGKLIFYKDAALTQEVSTFNTAEIGTKTFYYTYQEEGKQVSDKGTLTVIVKGNETLTVKSNPADATITCDNPEVTLSIDGASSATQYKWTNPNAEESVATTLTTSIKGNYTVEGTGSNGCPAYGSIQVKENTTKPVITSIKSTDSKGNETNVVTCSEGTLTITPEVSTSNVTYQWDNNKTTSSITETEKGVYTLIVKDKTNGCTSEPKSITLDKDDTVPSVTITSFNSMDSDADETNVLTCSNKEIYLVANVDQNDVTYIWQGNEANNKSNFKVTAPGEYTLKVVSNTNGCTLDGIKYEVKQDVENPTVSLRTEFNEDGTASSTVFTCDRVEIKLVADTESSPVEIDSYKWSNNATTESWQVMDTPGVYSVVVTAKNGCYANAEITLTLDNSTPIATITQSADTITCDVISSTISATTDIESNYEWTFGDKTYTDVTEITVETKGTGSLKVISKETGCEALPVNFTVEQSIEKPSVPVIDETKLALCPETGNYDLSSFIKDKKNNITYTFYDASGEALSAATVDTKTPNTQYSYTVVATAKNGCDSETAEFDVVVDGFVDFDLVLSTTEPLVVGDDIVATVVPTGVEADTYTWQLNGDKVSEEGLEYSTKLYLDTEFLVTATSRCDVKTKTAAVEVIWPTAFTPHNNNGKNDSFADGMEIIVFNRFYTKIFEGNNGWDGTINGAMNDGKNLAVPGVYYYSVKLPNGKVKKGKVEIVKND